jgi:hypothetical protein
MRICSVPGCGVEITACNGTTKAGDMLEMMEGRRTLEAVRELCPKHATIMIFQLDSGADPTSVYKEVGWG